MSQFWQANPQPMSYQYLIDQAALDVFGYLLIGWYHRLRSQQFHIMIVKYNQERLGPIIIVVCIVMQLAIITMVLCQLIMQIQEQISSQPTTRLSDQIRPSNTNYFTSSATNRYTYPSMKTSKQQRDHNVSFTDDFDSKHDETQTNKLSVNQPTSYSTLSNKQYQVQIAQLNEQLSNKHQRILSLQQQICQLKSQEDYLIAAIQELRDKNNLSALQFDAKTLKNLKIKENQIQYFKKQVNKLKQWLKQQKAEAFRCIQCVKMKDIIIENLQKQNEKLKQQIQPKKKVKKTQIISSQNNQMQEEDQLTKQKKRKKQLEHQINELTQQIDHLRHDNAAYKTQLSKINMVSSCEQPQSPIFKLQSRNFSRLSQPEEISLKQSLNIKQNTHYKFLASKCLQLQSQIQKFLNQIIYLRAQNEKIKAFSQSPVFRRQDDTEQVLKQDHFQFGQ